MHTIKRALCTHCYNSKGWFSEIANLILTKRQELINQGVFDQDIYSDLADKMRAEYDLNKSTSCLVVEVDGSTYLSVCKTCLAAIQNDILTSTFGWTIAPITNGICKFCRDELKWDLRAAAIYHAIAKRNPQSPECIEEATKYRNAFWISMQAPCLCIQYKASTPFSACGKHVQTILDSFPE